MPRFFYFIKQIYVLTFLYLSPSNLSFNWNFGSLALVFLLLQIITGLCLSWYYIPHLDWAFTSVEFIMREISNGWILRYAHANGASFFFFVTYIHISRSLFYNSYQKPRAFVWLSGLVIFFLMILTAFLGYVLPWGQMSFWAATVITSLTTVIPLIGNSLLMLIWGGFGIGQQTLSRFYSFHFLLPFILLILVGLHLLLLHISGSSNPVADSVFSLDKITFHPYYTYKDLIGVLAVFLLYFVFIFYFPNVLGHPLNYIPANPGVTPVHIVPEWYFLPFYGILRAIPSKIFGVILMLGSLFLLATLPLLAFIDVKHGSYRPFLKVINYFFFINFIMLGWVGYHVLESPFILLSRVFCFFYILLFSMFFLNGIFEQYIFRTFSITKNS
jgi:ubiquinol-cytochrome c reductase cytochrome b subunit